jgi:hypothetical protein
LNRRRRKKGTYEDQDKDEDEENVWLAKENSETHQNIFCFNGTC